MLAAESPVRVRWTGRGDTIEISWAASDFNNLDGLYNYSVTVYGLAPVARKYNVGYRPGNELKTTATANFIADTNEYFRAQSQPTRVDKNETWRVCVISERELPPGTNTPRPIAGSERCSDPFNMP